MLRTVDETNRLIAQGRRLHVAGDAAALGKLARGDWIGGTIPYFLTAEGGCVDRERVFVTELPAEVAAVDIGFVAPDRLADIPDGAPDHGFSLIVLPAMSDAHAKYAIGAHDLPGLFETPVIGWVAGVHLDDLGHAQAMAFNGRTGEAATDRIAVLRAHVADQVTPRIGIINLFQQGDGDRFVFPETGFAADDCRINGQRASFHEYAKAREIDPRRPLVADLSGEMINVSFQAIDDAARLVRFYAPVLAGVEYRQAAPLDDYRDALLSHVAAQPVTPAFSCNCILNYLYADLAGDKALSITGPATFGEIAYVLLNQTLVYLELAR
ncbi:MAG TPA: hypothetical protein VGG99_15825 [Acetobacteraceae bacterium]|jgi:hypothetical protein